ncbi:MAG: ABC transporter substrate-binding protein [Candidatus Binatia bacterium]
MKPFVKLFGLPWLVLYGLVPLVSAGEHSAELVKQAKREGKVIWYTTLSVPESSKLAGLFQKHYPFAKVEIVRSGGGALVNRILAEFSGKVHTVDVILGADSRGGIPVFKKRGIITRYKAPERKFVASGLKDKDGYWTSLYQLTFILAYNTELVKPKNIPRNYTDLLKPQWKGRKILNDTENFLWFGALLNYWGREKGLAYFRKLAHQEQVFQRGARGRIQLVMAGEFPVTIGYGPHAQGYASQGAPIDWVPLEPVVVSPISILLAKQAPHPNAAKLFINFLFSKEAQLKLRDFHRIPSRTDMDPDPPRLFKGFKKITFDHEGLMGMSKIADLYRKTFGLTR